MNRILLTALSGIAFVAVGSSASASTFSTGPGAYSTGSGYLAIFAGRNESQGKLAVNHFVVNYWDGWTDISPAVTPLANTSVAAAWAPGELICVKTSTTQILCEQDRGNWMQYNGGNGGLTVSSPAVSAYQKPGDLGGLAVGFALVFTENSVSTHALRLITIPSTGTGGQNVVIPNAPTFTEVNIAKLGTSQNMICGWDGSGQTKCATINITNPTAAVTWTALHGAYGSRPTVIAPQSPTNGLLVPYVFSKSNFDSQLWAEANFLGTWSNPFALSGDINSAPAAVNWGADTMHIFARASFGGGNIWYTYYYQGSWGGWNAL